MMMTPLRRLKRKPVKLEDPLNKPLSTKRSEEIWPPLLLLKPRRMLRKPTLIEDSTHSKVSTTTTMDLELTSTVNLLTESTNGCKLKLIT